LATGAVELRNSVNAAFGVELPATATFDHPTTAALATFIASKMAPAVQVTKQCNWMTDKPLRKHGVSVADRVNCALQRLPLDSMAAAAAGLGAQPDGRSTTDVVSTSSVLATAVDQNRGKALFMIVCPTSAAGSRTW
jgi:Phosphopantetheine attachment site